MLFIIEVTRLLWIDTSAVMKLLQLFSHCSLSFFSKDLNYLFDTVLGQDGLICGDVGWWIRFDKVSDVVDDVNIGIGNIMEGTDINNQDDPSHGASIISFVIVIDGGKIP